MQTTITTNNRNFDIFDEVELEKKPELHNIIGSEETLLFSGILTKINKRAKKQTRILVITDKFIYNIKPKTNLLRKVTHLINPQSLLKRKIPIDTVWGFTMSSYHLSEQFVIHVTSDYDYRYEGGGRLEKVLRSICHAYSLTTQKALPLYIKDQDLSIYHTTDKDFERSINKKPKDGAIALNKEKLDKGVGWLVLNRFDLMKESSKIYTLSNNPIQKANSLFFDSKVPNSTNQTTLSGSSGESLESIYFIKENNYLEKTDAGQNDNSSSINDIIKVNSGPTYTLLNFESK